MFIDEDEYLAHYGTLRKSGRYPWGSGDNQSTRNMQFLDYVNDLKKSGMSDAMIAKGLALIGPEDDWSSTSLRARQSIAVNEQRQSKIHMAEQLRAKGMGYVAIGERMGIPESSVRALLVPGVKDRADVLQTTANMLRGEVGENNLIDIGSGVENHLNINATKLQTAVAILKEEGYVVHSIPVTQVGTRQDTHTKVLCAPGTTWGQAASRKGEIKFPFSYSMDGGHTYDEFQPPLPISSKRVGIKYGSEGGTLADGVIYVRKGVKDVSLGQNRYAQVRVLVDGTHYLKGMAMYKDDMPDGVDLVFNTNKEDTGHKLDAMKKIEPGENPFGTTVRQLGDRDEHGTKQLTSTMNLVREEGQWAPWSKAVSTQMLSKQSPRLAKTQLDMTYEDRVREFEEISALTNPTVRKKLLKTFSDETDSAAVHLEAAAISSRQRWHAILPIESLKPTEVYAPNFKPGEVVALIRFPHAGTFEIPILTVNNKNREAKALLGDAIDAVGIHHSVAQRLSGADFDGDTVLVIPNGSNRIISTPALEGLKNFDPKAEYRGYPGMVPLTKQGKGLEMGKISNLITDMSIKQAPADEIVRAVKHSMVVIDAEKHELNYKQSAIDNGISALKAKYQGGANKGATTLISRATADLYVPDRKPRPARDGGPIDKVTGELKYVPTGKISYRTGKEAQLKSTKLAETTDAHTLSSGTPMERLYADHSNKLKSLANLARKDMVNTNSAKYSPSAKKTYAAEVASLDHKFQIAKQNAPLERAAQRLAGTMIKAKRDAQPNLDEASMKKIRGQCLTVARDRIGAKKTQVFIEQNEWDAIQQGAISDSRLRRILDNADLDQVRKLATPRDHLLMSPTKTDRAKQMLASGFTRAEVAERLGVSVSTLDKATTGEE